MLPVATAGAQKQTEDVLDTLERPKGVKGYVCMIAYTDYVIDARVRREAETLASQGFDVMCLTATNGDEPRRFALDRVEVQELRIPKYRGKSTTSYLRSYLRFLIAASAVCLRHMRHRRLDVVHVHNLPDFLVLAGLLPRLAGKKVVLDVHDSLPETFATKFANGSLAHKVLCLEERLSALLAHRVICVNHPQRDVLVSRGIPRRKTFVSMNVPDPRIFGRPRRHERGAVGRTQFDLVYHGTMVRRLGVDLIIRAVAELRDRIPGLRLHLWGGGDDLAAFQSLADSLHLDGHVQFRPRGFPLHQLPEQLERMDLGVVGNRRSVAGDLMLPVKLMEYISLGIPAVVPRLPTIQHYFSEDMVSYYDPDDVSSLSGVIDRLYRDPELRVRQAVKAEEVLDVCGWERQGSELVGFYKRLVEN
jgi:glycosyltransferase involved in cell wall biosynthesis